MAPKRCCCNAPCELGSDNFDRADSFDPGPKWEIISGDWEIASNTLQGEGQIATTVCHPSVYEIGSYVASMLLVGMSDGSTSFWEVWVGDPVAPAYRIEVTHNSGTMEATLSLYDSIALLSTQTYSGVTANQTLRVCWAPGMMVSAFLGGFVPHIDECSAILGERCYTAGMASVGGFSFAEGRFDDWVYNVHYIENQNCEACSCFCWRTYYDEYGMLAKDYSCIPDAVTLTFESVGADAATFPDIGLTQSFGSPSVPWPNKEEGWNSAVYSCGSPVGAQFAFRLLCGRPIDQMALIPLNSSYSSAVGAGAQIVWSWLTGDLPLNSSRQAIAEGSTCDPLSLVFPEIKINSAFPGPGCDFGLFPFGAYQPYCGSRSGDCFASEPDIRFVPRIVV